MMTVWIWGVGVGGGSGDGSKLWSLNKIQKVKSANPGDGLDPEVDG